ncbi:hypothetical protein FEM48_Zijuj10G0099600 [Ziziphus jujuba var. spinosa]|uniref:Uncharacterized protein n=1 Tax=Ziziphus jujuba var. spinosa TaxID=714518 RepID=A0A978UMQ3_ZIZJJ|nr:hypothetical protein FEM48_Zijuj10G0099600 [Ziziphus jujuba var. spinosa]
MKETHENCEQLYLLACVCDLESQKLEYPLTVPINFPKKPRSLSLKRRPTRFPKPPQSPVESCVASNLKVWATVLGKRCFFQQVDDADQLHSRKKQRKMTTENQGGSTVKLVIEKKLTSTDLDKANSRISMPLSKIHSEFLTEDEKESLTIKKGKLLLGIDVLLWDPFLDHSNKLCFKKWDYNNSNSYMSIENWNYVADKNDLRDDMMV